MDTSWLLVPPVAFLVMFALVWLESASFDGLALRVSKDKAVPKGKYKAYACGENVADHRVQPDYGQFFPFAFFFTIMHVVALIVTTVPTGTGSFVAASLAILFLVSAGAGVFVLFRR